jgi:hypothetical protein
LHQAVATTVTEGGAMSDTKTTATQVGRDATERVREQMTSSEFAQKAKEAAYTIVGLGVMGAQKATAATKQASKQLGVDGAPTTLDLETLRARSKDATVHARRQLSKADEVLSGALARIEEAFAPIEERLPDAARDAVQRLREAGKELHTQVRTRVAGELEKPKATARKRDTTASAA